MYGVRVYGAHQQSAGHRELCPAPAPPPPRPTLLCIHAAWSRVVLNDCARISRNQAPAQHCSFGREDRQNVGLLLLTISTSVSAAWSWTEDRRRVRGELP